MNPVISLIALVALSPLFAGCGRPAMQTEASVAGPLAGETVEGIAYNAKSGLRVAPDTAKWLGLETVEISERPFAAALEVSATVFRPATVDHPFALASALVAGSECDSLRPGMSSKSAEIVSVGTPGAQSNDLREVVLQVADAGREWNAGSRVVARFATGSTNAVVVIPRESLLRTLAGDFVYVVDGEHFTRAAIKSGRLESDFIEVTDGLFAGDKVVVRPVMTLWMSELHHVNGGDACCVAAPKK